MTNHPITPPPTLVQQWYLGAKAHPPDQWVTDVATQAACWGADQELEACCEWLCEDSIPNTSNRLRFARRPKPPSLKEQALEALETIPKLVGFESERDAIRRALEALPND
jgi:hypothetical protein